MDLDLSLCYPARPCVCLCYVIVNVMVWFWFLSLQHMAELSEGFILWRSPCCYICVSLHLHPPPSPLASRGVDIAVQLSTALFPPASVFSPGVVSYEVQANIEG